MTQPDKTQVAAVLAATGRRLARWPSLRPVVLWLWKKTLWKFLD